MTAVIAAVGLVWIAVSAVAAAEIAEDRGRRSLRWMTAGLLFPGFGPVIVWLMPPAYGRCPACAEPVRPAAVTCRYCGADLAVDDAGT